MSKETETPASDRLVTRGDNNPPEPVGLVRAAEIPTAHQESADALRTAHLETFLTYLRVPAVIEDKDVYDRVTTLAVMVKRAFDAIDKARSAAKKPYIDGGSAIDKAYAIPVEIDDQEKPGEKKTVNMLAELKSAHDSLKKRLSAYDTAEYQKAEQQRLAEAANLAEVAARDGIVLDATQMGEGRVQSGRSGYGGSAVKKVTKTFTISDASKVPASMCSPDPAKIQAAIDAGATEIPGVEIEVAVNTHVR